MTDPIRFSYFIACSAIVTLAALAWVVKDVEDKRAEAYQIRERSEIAECRRRGGMWTRVGGTQVSYVYGCVFPPPECHR